jgi:glycosyltransferase involved in cell wall biosynthesis
MTDQPVILQVLPALRGGGVERSTVEIAQAITQAGGLALVASDAGRMVAQVQAAGAEHLRLPLDSKNPFRIWRNASRLEKLIRDRRVRIVHARSRAPAWSAWLACQRTGTTFVTTCHGIYGEGVPLKHRYNEVMARGARVIANSVFMARHIATTYGLDEARIRVIPRGVDPAAFDPVAVNGTRMARLAEAWQVPDSAPILLLPGRITALKGQDVLLRALARLRHTDAVAVFVGEPKQNDRFGSRLAALTQELGLSERVRFAGHCDDIAAAMKLADIVISASVEPEAFGRTIIEAQAMRRLVVASDHGGTVETIAHGETGWRVPPGDAAALAEALDALLDLSPDARAAIGDAARESVQAHYTVRAMQDATLAVYAELL